MPTTVRAVIFDLDDTLFDHGGSVRDALTSWLPQVSAADLTQLTTAWFDLEHVHYDSWRAGHISSTNSDAAGSATSGPISAVNSRPTTTSTHCSPPT